MDTAEKPVEVIATNQEALAKPPKFTEAQLLDPAFDQLDLVGAEVDEALMSIVQAMVRNEEDVEQVSLADSLQKHRALLLKFATLAYMKKPSSAMLLSSITSLVGAMEKAIRDDRKERAKKEENASNQFSFSQIVESLNAIAAGAVVTPTFELTSFILDPTKSLMDIADGFKPIKPEELVQGNTLVDIDGNVM